MLTCVPVHPEGPRYATSLIFLPGLWAAPDVLRPLATFLGHRGWEGLIADFAGAPADPQARAAAVAAVAASRPAPPVVVGCDASGVLALQAARRAAVAAVVWLAPVRPGSPALRRAVSPWAVLRALVSGADVGRPRGAQSAGLFGRDTAGLRDLEVGPVVVDAVRGRTRPWPAGVPTLLLSGERDHLLAPPAARRLADEVGGEAAVMAGAPHWLLGPDHWLACASRLHRWLVQRLGEPLLELYAETIAERDESE